MVSVRFCVQGCSPSFVSMSLRTLQLFLAAGLLALPGSAWAQLTGSISGVFTASSTVSKISFTNISSSGVTLNTGESITPTYASFGTWNNTTSSYFDTTVLFNNAKNGTNVGKAKASGTFALTLTLTAPVATTITLGTWNWAFDGASGVGDNKLDFQLVSGGTPATYVSGSTNGGVAITWNNNTTGTFTVSNKAYAFTLYGGTYSAWDGSHPFGSLVNDAPLAEASTFTVNAGFQINSITTVPEPSTYALGATSLLLGAMGMRSVRRRRQAAAKSGPAA